jgi:2-dehydro-3-deoxyphosphogluconate aldolase/(4S)-4-hydroxy-2-oxoglutarate aldolase
MICMNSLFSDSKLARIRTAGVIAVLILDDVDSAVPLAQALLKGGVDAIELTLRTPVALDCLKAIRQAVPEMMTGVGTVLNPAQVDQIVAAGADFGVAPGVNPRVVRRALELGLPFAPGIMTPTDIETAVELGCREMKFFPAEHTGGLKMLASIRAPFAHLGVQFIPLGGVTAANMREYLTDPGVLAVGGSWLAKPDQIRSRSWDAITAQAAEARQITDQLRRT